MVLRCNRFCVVWLFILFLINFYTNLKFSKVNIYSFDSFLKKMEIIIMVNIWVLTSHWLIKSNSVQFRRSVVSDSLRPHGLQHARPPCPLPTPGVYSNSCPLSQWCHSTISSSVVPFSSAFNLSQHQGLFKWVSSSHQVAKVLEF